MRRVGDNCHAMTYTIAGGELFNMVLTHPDNTPLETWESKTTLEEMKSHYRGWDAS
jgi:salicylate hydroxylase